MKYPMVYQIQFIISVIGVGISFILVSVVINQSRVVNPSQYQIFNLNSHVLRMFKTEVKKEGPKPIKIICWIMCTDINLANRAHFIKATWGPRCDITLYFSDTENKTFPAIGLYPPGIGRKYLSQKSQDAWKYIYDHYRNDGDFFVKADDDTYLIVENLREYLSHKESNSAEYYGRRFQFNGKGTIYMSGGAGIVLTRTALTRLVRDAYPKNCMPFGQMEDLKTGRCLSLVNVLPVDTRDEFGKEKFHPFPPRYHFTGKYPPWFNLYDLNGAVKGRNCCSDYPISFHYIRGEEQLAMDFLFYSTKVSKI